MPVQTNDKKLDGAGLSLVWARMKAFASSIFEGYLNPSDGKFYETREPIVVEEEITGYTYSGEITSKIKAIYIELSTGRIYKWYGLYYGEIGRWYELATPSVEGQGGSNGLMSAADKAKLDGIETGAQAHNAPTTAEVKSALNVVTTSQGKYLKDDGTWDTPPDTTYSTMGASGASHAGGLVPDTPTTAGTTKFLREDGTWQTLGSTFSASSVPISADYDASQACTITSADDDGKSQTVVFTNSGSSDLTVTLPSSGIYNVPSAGADTVTCPAGGYCEVNFLNITDNNTVAIYVRAL